MLDSFTFIVRECLIRLFYQKIFTYTYQVQQQKT